MDRFSFFVLSPLCSYPQHICSHSGGQITLSRVQVSTTGRKKLITANTLPDVVSPYFLFYFIYKAENLTQQKLTSCRGSKAFRCEGLWFKGFFSLGMCLSRGFLLLAFVKQGPSLTLQILDILYNGKIKNITKISSF